jgi:2-dehydropantoate 2-reductase
MRILILGAGGTGGYFGGRLVESGADVTFLVRPERARRLKENGLVIKSPAGNAELQVATLQAGERSRKFDVVLVTCKAYDLDSATDAIERWTWPRGRRHRANLGHDQRLRRDRAFESDCALGVRRLRGPAEPP